MHNNFYFIKRLVFELDQKLKGTILVEVFSQNKDELILGFSISESEVFYIKANLSTSFSCLSFSSAFARSKQNSIDLFQDLIEKEVKTIRYFLNERSFYIDFDDYKLVIKLFGRFSNAILFQEEQPVFLFNQHFEEDGVKCFSDYHKDIDQTQQAYLDKGFHEVFPTLRGGVEAELKRAGFFDKNVNQQFEELQGLANDFLCRQIRVGVKDGKWNLTMLDTELENLSYYDSALEALTSFYLNRITSQSLDEGKSKLLRERQVQLKKLKKTFSQQRIRLKNLEEGISEKEIADILMANLYQVPERSTQVELFDFYRNQPIKIVLKKDLNAQGNAERYYRRSKNSHLEKTKLQENIRGVESRIDILQQELNAIESAESYKELKGFIKQKKAVNKEELPFKVFDKLGFKILVGRNAKNNDLLTLKYAFKDDLWLHAKDVSGSHVIIKTQAGKNTPKQVIEYAASIAAYYSKRKTDSLCPVTVTPKKFVRKVKGSPAGAVHVEKEEVILVQPKL